jgi:hypothetical protein
LVLSLLDRGAAYRKRKEEKAHSETFTIKFKIMKEIPMRNLGTRMKRRKKQHSNEAGDPCEADRQSDKERKNQPQRGKQGIPA